MADISIEKRADLTWVWAIAAIVATVGLMVWLFSTKPANVPVAAAPEAEPVEAVAELTPLASIGAGPDQFVGRELEVASVPVTAALGQRTFWADIPGASPFLVVIGPAVQDVSWIREGSTATLRGTVQPVTEAVLDGLVTAGALLPEGRSQAVFATHYFSASEVP